MSFIDTNANPKITDNARCITAKQISGASNYPGEHSGVLVETAPCAVIAAREKMNQITRLHTSGILSNEIYNTQKKEIEAKMMRLKELMTAATDTDGIISTLDQLSDLMDILDEHKVMTEFDETVFGLTVEKMTAMFENEIIFRLIGGVEFTEIIDRRTINVCKRILDCNLSRSWD